LASYLRKHSCLPSKIHLGCGSRRVRGWLNVDVMGSDIDCDLASGKLPFSSGHFNAVVSQHVIEHLEIKSQLMRLLVEVRRVVAEGGRVFLSCPDLGKVCRSYVESEGQSLVDDRLTRVPDWSLDGLPSSQIVNHLFHQDGEHKNLFDFTLLSHLLLSAGFSQVREIDEQELLGEFPEFPARNDELQTLYVVAVA